jgi:oxygen-dependent protoporphyrinogen oxidase
MSFSGRRIGIVGGGIAGLAAAWRLSQLCPDANLVLFESSSRLGGVLQTERVDGYVIETSADMFTTEPSVALDFCQQLGKADNLIQTKPVKNRAYLATPDGLCPIPQGFSLMLPNNVAAVLDSDLLDEAGKARFLAEEQVPVRNDSSDECLESFAVRRFGKQVFDRLIQPLVSGIYTADPMRLSLRATMARFETMVRAHGSLIGAGKAKNKTSTDAVHPTAEQSASGARYDLFRAPENGMQQLVEWLIDELPALEARLQSEVASIESVGSKWQVSVKHQDGRAEPVEEEFDGMVLATSARAAGHLLTPKLASEMPVNLVGNQSCTPSEAVLKNLSSIEAASCAIVVLGFDEEQLQQPFDGYGIVVPSYLNRRLIAASFSSNKFAGRAPEGKVLIRCFVGGALQSELVDLSDSDLVRLAGAELDQLIGITGEPELSRVYRWRNTMPQYHVGHLERIDELTQEFVQLKGLELAGNSYSGVGIPVCLDSGFKAAERIVEYLTAPAG